MNPRLCEIAPKAYWCSLRNKRRVAPQAEQSRREQRSPGAQPPSWPRSELRLEQLLPAMCRPNELLAGG